MTKQALDINSNEIRQYSTEEQIISLNEIKLSKNIIDNNLNEEINKTKKDLNFCGDVEGMTSSTLALDTR